MSYVFSHLKFFFVLCNVLIYSSVHAHYFGRDWAVWTKAKRIIEIEISEGRALGIHPSTELKNFDLFTYGLNIRVNPIYLYSPNLNNAEFNLITGKGVILKNDSLSKIEIEIAMPLRQENTCGFVIISSKDLVTDFISKIKIYWKNDIKDEYDIIARPDTGDMIYKLNLKNDQDKKAFFFDSVPARYFKFVMFTDSGKPIKLRVASINKCIYNGRHIITNCGEKMENNKKFQNQKYGVPIGIKCPTDCIRTWPCWGFKIYSTDSPICWTAKQNFGKWGNGEYTIYKIKKVIFFRDQVNPLLNHGVYCRKSVVQFNGFTFDRKYYDFSIKEMKKIQNSNL